MRTGAVLRVAGGIVLMVAASAVGAAWALDRFFARDVVLILPFAPEVVELNRATRETGESAASIYGTPVGGDATASERDPRPRTTRVVFPNDEKLLRPKEDPEILLLQIDPTAGDHPLQSMSLRWCADRVARAGALLAAALWSVGTVIRRRAVRRAALNDRSAP